MTNKPSCGFILVAAAKDHYFDLAVRAAQSIRRFHPDAEIDLFADRAFEHPALSQTHIIPFEKGMAKPRALRESRFDLSFYMDSDVLVTAPIADVFDVLERFDIAVCHDQYPTNTYCMLTFKRSMPACFPHFNGGVMALRKTQATDDALIAWEDAIREHATGRDQAALRYTLWQSDLRIATLPPEYNMMNYDLLKSKAMDHTQLAPRIVHNPHFYQFYDLFKDRKDPVADCLGPQRMARLEHLVATDQSLVASSTGWPRAGFVQRLRYRLRAALSALPRWPGHLLFQARYFAQRMEKKRGR